MWEFNQLCFKLNTHVRFPNYIALLGIQIQQPECSTYIDNIQQGLRS